MSNNRKELFRYKSGSTRVKILFPILLCLFDPMMASGDLLEWARPDIDQWLYPANGTPGSRILGPTFGSLGGPGSSTDPARRGATVLGFNTSIAIEADLAPHQYEINSIRINLTNGPGNGNIVYDNTYDLISDLANDTDDPGRPIELFGLGFRDNYPDPYEKLGFDPVDYAPPEFEEGTSLFSSNTGAYDLFPLGDDGSGNLTDVYNSPTGGYNARHEEPVPAWDTVPWAIGVVPDLTPGSTVPYESNYTFQIDLGLPNVLEHLQQSLADGGVGFFVSSLHQPAGHTGTIAYPQWYLKEHPRGTAATMEMDVNILSDGVAGDFDGDQLLGIDDINLLTTVVASGSQDLRFDINGDLGVSTNDLRVWVKEIKRTWFGDTDLDGEFNSRDLVAIFAAGKYEQDISATWTEGDWDADGRFGTGDLIKAFEDGGYDMGPQSPTNGVPEPATLQLLLFALFCMLAANARKR
ncbi:MAG: hypothetical protein P8N76_18945 [Pirellulaceae bacterium]|nr:hypothetical protein [Pirellulaceae bacterium]